ncbi:MAG: gamma-glutamyltransferase [Deltaproteobacteria bacterium]|nr:gamma-glutamyltransferase [Deltaproteobacteria bacterium]
MSRRRGVVAAGSKATAQAAAEVLEQGGNAVDAAVAACFATSAGEPSLTSLAGGGVMMVHEAESGRSTLCDFFVDAPGLGAPPVAEQATLDFFPVELIFGPARQTFYVGRASAAVPSALPGLCTAHDRWGSLPLAQVMAPARRMLVEGIELGDYETACFELLRPILTHSDGPKKIFTADGKRMLCVGDRFTNPQLADTLGELAESKDWRAWHKACIDPLVLRDFGISAGGRITQADLDHFRPVFRDPVERVFQGHRIRMNPPPAAGGQLIGLFLAILEGRDLDQLKRGSPAHLNAVRTAQRVVEESRCTENDPLTPKAIAFWRLRYDALLENFQAGPPPQLPSHGSTTHISVVDNLGNGAAVTLSHGEACGYTIGDTGITMNNEMGEADLLPDGFHSWPAGERLATMMSPTVWLEPDGAVGLMGTGGSSRIRTAIAQVLLNLLEFGLPVQEAVNASRLHWEGDKLNAEVFDLPGRRAAMETLASPEQEMILFDEAHLYFGGVHTVRRRADGSLEAGGDPRRSGTALEV